MTSCGPAADYAGRRVLVTGGTGFLGTHLVRALVSAGANVHAIVRPSGTSRRVMVDGVETHEADLLDATALARAVRAADPVCVFHLAAYGTTSVQRDEALMLRVNVDGTNRLWEALEGQAFRLVQTGSCAEYGDVCGPIAETHACRPLSRYPATVHTAVTLSQTRGIETGREVVILRPFGPFGPGDRPERLLPYVISQLLDRHRAKVSDGAQLRDYSHVDDHIAAMMLAGACTLVNPVAIYNVGSGRPIAVRELLEMVAREIGGDAIGRIDFGARPLVPYEAPEMYADIAAISRDFGFTPAIPLPEGLRRMVSWHRAVHAARC